jgi:hypothetical protein
VRQTGSKPSGQYADLTLEWDRPKDRLTSNGVDSCIDTYNVQIIRVSDWLQDQEQGLGAWGSTPYVCMVGRCWGWEGDLRAVNVSPVSVVAAGPAHPLP